MYLWNCIQVLFLTSWIFSTAELSKLQYVVLDWTCSPCFQSEKHTNFIAWTHEMSRFNACWTWNSWSYNMKLLHCHAVSLQFCKNSRETNQMLSLLCIMCIHRLDTSWVYVRNLPFLSNHGSHSILDVLSSVVVSAVSLQSIV